MFISILISPVPLRRISSKISVPLFFCVRRNKFSFIKCELNWFLGSANLILRHFINKISFITENGKFHYQMEFKIRLTWNFEIVKLTSCSFSQILLDLRRTTVSSSWTSLGFSFGFSFTIFPFGMLFLFPNGSFSTSGPAKTLEMLTKPLFSFLFASASSFMWSSTAFRSFPAIEYTIKIFSKFTYFIFPKFIYFSLAIKYTSVRKIRQSLVKFLNLIQYLF